MYSWAKQQSVYGESKSWFISTNSGESLFRWRKALAERIECVTEEFRQANLDAGKHILSYSQLQKAVKQSLSKTLHHMDMSTGKGHKETNEGPVRYVRLRWMDSRS